MVGSVAAKPKTQHLLSMMCRVCALLGPTYEWTSMLHARTRLPRTEGSVRVRFVRGADGRTVLADLRQSGAGRVRFPKPTGDDAPEAVLLNTAGGLTGGDRITIEVSLSAQCSATVSSAAAE